MLDQNIITHNDIKYTLTATAHISHDFFANVFQTLLDTLTNLRTEQLDNITSATLAKECINSVLGLRSETLCLMRAKPCPVWSI